MFEDLLTGPVFASVVAVIIAIAGYFFLMKVFDGKYPKVYVLVTYKGSRRLRTYRDMNGIIVEDSIIDILTQNYHIMGDKSSLEWYIQDIGPFTRGVRVYDAELVADWFFKRDKKVITERSVEVDTKTLRVGKEGLLFPLKYPELKNPDLADIRKGKVIVERIVTNLQSNKAILDGNNPLLTIVYTSLPILLIVIAVGVMLYLTQTGMADTNFKILEKLDLIRGDLAAS